MEYKKCTINMKSYNSEVSVSIPNDSDIDDTIQAVITCLRGIGFCESVIKDGFKNYLQNYSDDDGV